MEYKSWISVSDFLLVVEADNEEEAMDKLKDKLNKIVVTVTEKKGGYETVDTLDCMITDVDPA